MSKLVKAISITALVIALLNLVLLALGKINVLVFWIVIIALAIIAFPVMNMLNKK